MIKAIILDHGNVIAELDNDKFLKRLQGYGHMPANELAYAIYEESTVHEDYILGRITSQRFYRTIKTRCRLSISREEFRDAYTSVFTEIKETTSLIRKLYADGYILALLSDTSYWDYMYVIRANPIFPLFRATTLSFRVKARKPSSEIYADALRKLRLEPSQCIYIDDIEEYVDVASSIGFKGIHYESPALLVESLAAFDVSLRTAAL